MRYLFPVVLWLLFVTAVEANVIVAPKTADHKDFVRIALVWPKETNFEYKVVEGGVEVKFFEPAELVLDQLVQKFPGSFYKTLSDATVLSLRFNGNRKTDIQSYSNVVYIDVYRAESLKVAAVSEVNLPSVNPQKLKGKDGDAKLEVPHPALSNLFKKVSDYLDYKPNEDIVLTNDKDILIKKPKVPIAVYKDKENWCVVVQDKLLPSIHKAVRDKYSIEAQAIQGGFVLQIKGAAFKEIAVRKTEDGWLLENSALLQVKPLLITFSQSESGVFSSERFGLFPPVRFGNVSVFCSLDANVMFPLGAIVGESTLFSTRVGLAIDAPAENIGVSEQAVSLVAKEEDAGALFKQLLLPFVVPWESFSDQKRQYVADILKHPDSPHIFKMALIMLYLQKLFVEEAWDEIVAIDKKTVPKSELAALNMVRCAALLLMRNPSKNFIEQALNNEDVTNLGYDVFAWYSFCASAFDVSELPERLVDRVLAHIAAWPMPARDVLLVRLSDVLLKQKSVAAFSRVLRLITPSNLSKLDLSLYYYLLWQQQAFENTTSGDVVELRKILRQTESPELFARIVSETELLDWKNQEDVGFVNELVYMLPLLGGSSAHPKALKYIIKFYIHQKDFMRVLDAAITLKDRYSEYYDDALQSNVRNIVAGMIATEKYKEIGLIQTLRILNAFADVLPLNTQYVEFILVLTKKLHAIGMTKESISLIEQYIGKTKEGFDISELFKLVHFLLKLYLENDASEDAIKVIEKVKSRIALSNQDMKKINILEAEVALKQGKVQSALGRLEGNNLFEALRLKNDIFLKQKAWKNVAETLEAFVGLYIKDIKNDALKESYILQWVVALVLYETDGAKNQAIRRETREKIAYILKTHGGELVRHKKLLQELVYNPNNSMQQELGRKIIELELEEVDRLDALFKYVQEVKND